MTKSRSRRLRVAPRTSRATVVQPTSATMKIIRYRLILSGLRDDCRESKFIQVQCRHHNQEGKKWQSDDAVGTAHERHRANPMVASNKADNRSWGCANAVTKPTKSETCPPARAVETHPGPVRPGPARRLPKVTGSERIGSPDCRQDPVLLRTWVPPTTGRR